MKKKLKKIFKKILNIRKAESNLGYQLYQYKDKNGEFDYDLYKKIQENGNKKKIDNIWVIEDNIKFLSDYIAKNMKPKFGICHGTRRGLEQQWFSKYLNCEVLGTEISSTALDFPNTIQWDFHDVKDEWINSVDFIYSNSFDHSFQPEQCLNTWMACIKKDGFCILEHSSSHEPSRANELDPFGADLVVMPYLITQWSQGKYGVKEILDAPKINEKVTYTKFIIIKKF